MLKQVRIEPTAVFPPAPIHKDKFFAIVTVNEKLMVIINGTDGMPPVFSYEIGNLQDPTTPQEPHDDYVKIYLDNLLNSIVVERFGPPPMPGSNVSEFEYKTGSTLSITKTIVVGSGDINIKGGEKASVIRFHHFNLAQANSYILLQKLATGDLKVYFVGTLIQVTHP